MRITVEPGFIWITPDRENEVREEVVEEKCTAEGRRMWPTFRRYVVGFEEVDKGLYGDLGVGREAIERRAAMTS